MGSSQSVSETKSQGIIDNKQDFKFDVSAMNQQQNQSIQNKYTLIHPPLGRGFYGEVYKAKHKKTGILRAVKRVRKYKLKSHEQYYFEDSIHQLKKIDHPNIIKLYEFYQTESDFYVVSELCTGGELLGIMKQNHRFSQNKAAELILQILRALQYCHKQNVLHGSLRPENILLAARLPNCCLKLTDFGILKDYNSIEIGSQKFGAPYYLAPQLLTEKADYKTDIWSVGVILYMMISGQLPFFGKTDEEIVVKIVQGKYSMDIKQLSHASREVKDLISKMIEPIKSQRYSARDCLNHPWFLQFSTKVFKNIRGYVVSSKLQQVIWVHMISMFVSPEQIEQLLEVFKSLDCDDDGCLTRMQLKSGFMRIGSAQDAEESMIRLQQIFQKSTMTFSQFLKCAVHPSTIIVQSNIQKMFRMFDQDENATISISELRKIMGNNKMITVHLLQDFMKQADSDSDGTISFDEFKKLLDELLVLRKQNYHEVDHTEMESLQSQMIN